MIHQILEDSSNPEGEISQIYDDNPDDSSNSVNSSNPADSTHVEGEQHQSNQY